MSGVSRHCKMDSSPIITLFPQVFQPTQNRKCPSRSISHISTQRKTCRSRRPNILPMVNQHSPVR